MALENSYFSFGDIWILLKGSQRSKQYLMSWMVNNTANRFIMMRKILLIIVFAMCSICSFANTSVSDSTSYEYWKPVFEAIIQVESGGKLNAVNGKCVGPMQISPGMVKSCNDYLKKHGSSIQYTLTDRTNLKKSIEMFLINQLKHNPSRNIEYAIRSWNGGPGFKINSTNHYYQKVLKKMNLK